MVWWLRKNCRVYPRDAVEQPEKASELDQEPPRIQVRITCEKYMIPDLDRRTSTN